MLGLEMEIKDKKEFIALAIFLAALFVFFIILNNINPLLFWDENIYLGNARSHITQSNFTEDFRFPLLEYILALVWFFTGESIFVARLIIIIFTLASVFFLYLISKKFLPKNLSFLLCILFSLCPIVLLWGFHAYSDTPAMFFIILSFYFILKLENKNILFIALSGFAAALAFLTRFPAALFALSLSLYFVFNKKFKALGIFILFFFIALIPWLIYNKIIYGNLIWDFQEQYFVISKWTFAEPVMKQINNLFSSLGYFIPFLMLFGISALTRKKHKFNFLILIYTIISFIYYFFFVNLKLSRYYLSFLPFIFLLSFQGLFWFKSRRNKAIRFLFIFLTIALIINAVFIFNDFVKETVKRSLCDVSGSMPRAIDYLSQYEFVSNGTNPIFSNSWPWFGYYLNVNASSIWTENITELIEFYDPDYFVHSNQRSEFYYKNVLDNARELKLERVFSDECDQVISIYKVKASSKSSFGWKPT